MNLDPQARANLASIIQQGLLNSKAALAGVSVPAPPSVPMTHHEAAIREIAQMQALMNAHPAPPAPTSVSAPPAAPAADPSKATDAQRWLNSAASTAPPIPVPADKVTLIAVPQEGDGPCTRWVNGLQRNPTIMDWLAVEGIKEVIVDGKVATTVQAGLAKMSKIKDERGIFASTALAQATMNKLL